MAVALATPLLGALATLRLELRGHLLFHYLFQDAFDSLADTVFQGSGDGLADVVVGHDLTGLVNPQN